MNTQTNTPKTAYQKPVPFYKKLSGFDWGFALIVGLIALFAQNMLAHHMDGYEKAILWGCVPGTIALGFFFKPMRLFIILSALLACLAVYAYGADITRADPAGAQPSFLLKYFLSSQAAIMWLCALVFIATFCYLIGLILPKKNIEKKSNAALSLGSSLSWSAALMGFTGLLVRWHESYLIGPDVGHIPVSNLYEVFVLFIVFTLLMYLYYEKNTRWSVWVFLFWHFCH